MQCCIPVGNCEGIKKQNSHPPKLRRRWFGGELNTDEVERDFLVKAKLNRKGG